MLVKSCGTLPMRSALLANSGINMYVLFIFFLGAWANEDVYHLGDLPMQNPDLFEGDILGIESPEDRNAIVDEELKWPEGIIYYKIDDTLDDSLASIIRDAMDDYEMNTCLKFVERDLEPDYVNMFKGEGCYSHVGKTGGAQPLSLGNGCHWPGTVAHEIGHMIGFFHEQNRSDRDEYIDIHWENIEHGMEAQFTKLDPTENTLYNEFEYESIMLYGETAFSKDKISKTMTAKEEGVTLIAVSDKDHPTESDYFRINKLYHCNDE